MQEGACTAEERICKEREGTGWMRALPYTGLPGAVSEAARKIKLSKSNNTVIKGVKGVKRLKDVN